MTRLDSLDRDVNAAVIGIRSDHNAAQRRLNLPVTDHRDRDPFEQADDQT